MSQLVRIWIGSLVLLVVGSSPALAQRTCDRDCLASTLDAYMAAVVRHDPGAAPVVVGFRQTENAINVAPGNGVWQSVTGLGEVQRKYLDPVSGQAAYFGTVEEGSETAIVTVRIRVENRMITEAEWYLARANDPGLNGPRQPGGPPANLHNPTYLAANPPPQRIVPPTERVDRDTLIRIAMSYFDALTSHDRTVALAHAGWPGTSSPRPMPPTSAHPG